MRHVIQDKLLTAGVQHGRSGHYMTPKGIVIHYVGNPGSSAIGNRNYFENGSGGAGVSAHYVIGLLGEILRCVPDTECAAHAGKAYGDKWKAQAALNNSTLIGIECCHPNADGKFNEATISALIDLCVELCRTYKLNPETDIYRHYDVCGKSCPLYYVNNPAAWQVLKGDIVRAYNAIEDEPVIPLKSDSSSAPKPTQSILANSRFDELRRQSRQAAAPNSASSSPELVNPLAKYGLNIPLEMNILYYDSLIKNASKEGILDERISNGITGSFNGLDVLVSAGVSASPNYWLDIIERDNKIAEIVIAIANKCRILLEKIIMAEAGYDDDTEGQILVGNVIFNRVKSSQFPNSIYDVVFQQNQFAPIYDGAYDKAVPNDSVKKAINLLLNGDDKSQGALYFRTIKGATPDCWHEKALTKVFDHGPHRFYR